jgi:microcystin-dependent protein
MSAPFVAEIRVVGFNFPPVGWAFCDGQLMPISQNTALFSLLGTMYGGDGKSTFGLPDIQGCAVVAEGPGPGLTYWSQGQLGGSETMTLLQSEMPVHNHAAMAAPDTAEVQVPAPNRSLARSTPTNAWQSNTGNLAPMAQEAIGLAGGGLPHNNMPPALVLNFVIALVGIFPARP